VNSRSIHRVRQVAWKRLTTSIRNEGIRPNTEIIRKKARGAIAGAQVSEGIGLSADAVIALRDKLVDEILEHWDPTKARRAPDKARKQRRVEGLEIASLEVDTKGSRRRLARNAEVSKSRVQRTLVESGLSRPWTKARLSPLARYLIEVVAFNVPPESRRAVSSMDLCQTIDVTLERLRQLFEEINAARTGFYLLLTALRNEIGLPWAVAIRGRRPTVEKVEEWLRRSEVKRRSRNPLRPDQRFYVVGIAPPARGLTEADFLALISVVGTTRNISQWRRYIEVTGRCLMAGERDGADLDAIIAVVRSAMKLTEATIYDEGMMTKIVGWIDEAKTRMLAGRIMSLTERLIERLERKSMESVVQEWADQVDYIGAISRGDLPGRSNERAQFLLAREEIRDEDIFLGLPDAGHG
jgi:hypothetical protein